MTDGPQRAIEFRVSRSDQWPTEVEPFVDGAPLSDLVGAFERERGYKPSDGYGGLVPEAFNSATSLLTFSGRNSGNGQSTAGSGFSRAIAARLAVGRSRLQ